MDTMNANEELITRFYSAFQKLDYKTMQDCYADTVTFSDTVFPGLNAAEVKAMWAMLCKNAKDFSLEFKNVKANAEQGSSEWTAHYTFSKTGRRVENRIRATFRFADGKIIEHKDDFSFYRWARQALGLSGLLLGWSSMLQSKVRHTARENLDKFMKLKMEN